MAVGTNTAPHGAVAPNPGKATFVTATIATETQQVPLAVPTDALQTVENEQVVFVRIPDGFEKRPVVVGRRDARQAEIVRGLRPGEPVAVSNTFGLN
jgi:cobalt-zinc-cadmium efflux system membrane fusion protein